MYMRRRVWFLALAGAMIFAVVISWAALNDRFHPRIPFYTLSWELSDAPPGNTAARRTFLWIRKNRHAIGAAARKRHVDARAIAGVVAYEALEDVQPPQIIPLARYSGPGKVHYRNYHFSEGDPVAKQVEEWGYLPRHTMLQRKAILATDAGAIEYIAAIMGAYADVARSSGREIACDPAILITFYSAWSLPDERHFLRRHKGRLLRPNDVGIWVHRATGQFLGAALGRDAFSPCDSHLRQGGRQKGEPA